MLVKSIGTDDKLKTLAGAARYDVCGSGALETNSRDLPLHFIHRAAVPDGGCTSLFKVLMTNACVNDCAYCVCAASRNVRRTAFKPEELARTFLEFNRRHIAEGLFLSSGIAENPDCAMEGIIKTVEILRQKLGFKGYIHAKMLPSASPDRIEAICTLASRVSVNIEAPTAEYLKRLSARKNLLDGILAPMRQAQSLQAAHPQLIPSGQTTQFVVGAAGESDADILGTTANLYKDIGLRRVYFSAYKPIPDTRLEGVPTASTWRQHRLYQADWLLRVYGFPQAEVSLALDRWGNLPLKANPKLVIARASPWLFPMDVNRASFEELLRVPGIGPLAAKRIVEMRRIRDISSVDQLKKLRVRYREAMPYIWFKGMTIFEKQLSFFESLRAECCDKFDMVPGNLGRLR